jgi:hypothetical protein
MGMDVFLESFQHPSSSKVVESFPCPISERTGFSMALDCYLPVK